MTRESILRDDLIQHLAEKTVTDEEVPQAVRTGLDTLYDLYKVLRRARSIRGAIDFATQETLVKTDEKGDIIAIVARESNDAHRLIEECMLAANTCAADFIGRHKKLSLYRVHDSPSVDKLLELRRTLSGFGLTLLGGNKPTAADYEKYEVFYRRKAGGGYRYTGWQTIGGKQYYYDPATHQPVTGVQVIAGEMYTFGADGAMGVNRKGIDVSKYQGVIDWNKVKADGVEFAIIRVGYRGYGSGALVEDSQFKNNIKGATAAGIKVGLYFYSQAINEQEAVDEAAMVLSLCKGYPISYPIFFDTEKVAGATGRADNISAAQRTANAVAFCNAIQSAGYSAGVYSYRDWFYYNLNFANIQKYKIWIAQYRTTLDFKYRYDIWQYSSSGTVNGISGRVDMNIGY